MAAMKSSTARKKASKSAATRKPAGKQTAGKTAKKPARKTQPKSPEATDRAKPAKRRARSAEPPLPEFAVVFIDADGRDHVAKASAPDPAIAVSGMLDRAERLEEAWLDELVAVLVMHPTTWHAVRKRVLASFRL